MWRYGFYKNFFWLSNLWREFFGKRCQKVLLLWTFNVYLVQAFLLVSVWGICDPEYGYSVLGVLGMGGILKKWCLKQSRSWIPSNCIPLPSVTSQLPIWCWSSCSIRFGSRELKKFVWVCASVVRFCSKGKGDGTLDGEQEWILARDTSVQGHQECKCCTQAAVVAIGDFYFCLLCWSSFVLVILYMLPSFHVWCFCSLSLSLSFSQWFSL